MANDLVIVDKTFFVTKFLPIADPINGRDVSFMANMERWVKEVIGGFTQVYKCEIHSIADLECSVFLDKGNQYNGIEWSPKRSTLYVANLGKSTVRAVEIDRVTKEIKKITDYDIKHHADNLYLDGDDLYAGVFVSQGMHDIVIGDIVERGKPAAGHKHPGGGIKLDLNTGKVQELVIQDKLYGSTLYIPVKVG